MVYNAMWLAQWRAAAWLSMCELIELMIVLAHVAVKKDVKLRLSKVLEYSLSMPLFESDRQLADSFQQIPYYPA